MPADPPRRRGTTVRFRVTAIAALAVAVVLVATAVALVTAQRRLLVESIDDSLDEHAASLATQAADGRLPEPLPAPSDDGSARVLTADGEVLARSAPRADDEDETGPRHTVTRAVDTPGGPAVVEVSAPLDDVDESVALLTQLLAVAVPATTAVLALLVWWLVGRTLRPVEAIRREVAGIGTAGSPGLDRRVPVPAGDDEVARLARTMNGMLDRLEDGAARQQRFVADASHELRSPLARIRSEIEVDLAHPDGADPTATARSVLDETVGLQHLVDDLLALARSDAGTGGSGRPPGPVDLDEVVGRLVRRVREGGRVAVDARGVGPARVTGDADRLGRAVANVVDNAVRHADTTVTVTLAEEDGSVRLTVADDGPGIPPGQRDAVFERFARLDTARSAGDGGTGLGLAIARDTVTEHGGTIEVDPDHSPGARLVITLPAAADGSTG
jgi:signal transduction histidine kinase